MSGDGSAAERAVVSKLARGSLLSRLKRSKQPLKLAAVPRDHVHGERARGDALLAGRFTVGSETVSLKDLDFAKVGSSGATAEQHCPFFAAGAWPFRGIEPDHQVTRIKWQRIK